MSSSEIYIECRPTDEDEGDFKGEDKVVVFGNKSSKGIESRVSNSKKGFGMSSLIKYILILVISFVFWNAVTFKVPENKKRYRIWIGLTLLISLLYSILLDTNEKAQNADIYGYSFAGLSFITAVAYIVKHKDTSNMLTNGVLGFAVMGLLIISILFGLEV